MCGYGQGGGDTGWSHPKRERAPTNPGSLKERGEEQGQGDMEEFGGD